MSKITSVRLKYYDTNGHNFGIEGVAPDRASVKKVVVCLPGYSSAEAIKALSAYKCRRRLTIRSKSIDNWLRRNSRVSQVFSATLTISDNGEEHCYSDFKPVWIV